MSLTIAEFDRGKCEGSGLKSRLKYKFAFSKTSKFSVQLPKSF